MINHKKPPMKNILKLFSFLYFILLLYQLTTAQVLPALVSVVLFILASPICFPKWKQKHYDIINKLNVFLSIPTIIYLLLILVMLGTGQGIVADEVIPTAEQHYIDTVLSQITTRSTKADTIALLGKPHRDLVAKVNWWVTIDGRDSRVGIYFDPTTGMADEIVLDGGMDRFYYRQTLIALPIEESG